MMRRSMRPVAGIAGRDARMQGGGVVEYRAALLLYCVDIVKYKHMENMAINSPK